MQARVLVTMFVSNTPSVKATVRESTLVRCPAGYDCEFRSPVI
jgi:hypothetical protein